MSEIERISDQLKRAFEGTAWHGPSVKEALSGVTAEKAAAKPLSASHSIWEIVLHIAAWESVVRRRAEGEAVGSVSNEDDWPIVADTTEQAWANALEKLEQGHHALRKAIASLKCAQLDAIAPGANYSVYFMLHGVIQHDLYHAGQIVLLKKA